MIELIFIVFRKKQAEMQKAVEQRDKEDDISDYNAELLKQFQTLNDKIEYILGKIDKST